MYSLPVVWSDRRHAAFTTDLVKTWSQRPERPAQVNPVSVFPRQRPDDEYDKFFTSAEHGNELFLRNNKDRRLSSKL